MAGAKVKTTITKTGPIFQHDPGDTFRGNVHRMMEAIRDEGARDVIVQLQRGDSDRAKIRKLGDRVSDHVTGELRKAPSGPGFSAVVFVETRGMGRAEAISTQAAASFLEGTVHPFRTTQGRILRNRAVTAEELLKGLT